MREVSPVRRRSRFRKVSCQMFRIKASSPAELTLTRLDSVRHDESAERIRWASDTHLLLTAAHQCVGNGNSKS